MLGMWIVLLRSKAGVTQGGGGATPASVSIVNGWYA